jgi:hypothetical protein
MDEQQQVSAPTAPFPCRFSVSSSGNSDGVLQLMLCLLGLLEGVLTVIIAALLFKLQVYIRECFSHGHRVDQRNFDEKPDDA